MIIIKNNYQQNFTENVTYEESKGRVTLEDEKNVPNAVFVLEDVSPDDQSELTCKGISKNTNESSDPSMGVVRVKGNFIYQAFKFLQIT